MANKTHIHLNWTYLQKQICFWAKPKLTHLPTAALRMSQGPWTLSREIWDKATWNPVEMLLALLSVSHKIFTFVFKVSVYFVRFLTNVVPPWEMCITSRAGSPALKHLKDKFVASRTNRPNLTSTMPRRAAAQICSKGTRQKIPGWVHNKIFWYLKKDPTKFTKLGRVSKDKSFSENKEKKLNTEKNLVSTIFIMSTCLWCPTCPPYSSPSRPVRDVPLY